MTLVSVVVWVIQKALWSFWKFVEFCFRRLYDLICLFCALVVIGTIWRASKLFKRCGEESGWVAKESTAVLELIILIGDLFTLFPFLLVNVTGWRSIALWRDLSDVQAPHRLYESRYRRIIWEHFGMLFVDLAFVPMGAIVMVSWRAKLAYRKANEPDRSGLKARAVFVIQCFNVLVDIPHILMLLLLMCTTRLPFLIENLRNESALGAATWTSDSFHETRRIAWHELGLFILDVCCIMMAVFALCTWRGYFVYKTTHEPTWKWTQENVRSVIAKNFVFFWMDIPCLICAGIAAPYRGRFYKRDVEEAKGNQEDLRYRSIEHFLKTMIDLVLLLFTLILVVTLWRFIPLKKAIKKHLSAIKEHEQRASPKARGVSGDGLRKKIAIQFVLLLVDVPLLCLVLVLLLTGIRTMKIIGALAASADFYKEFELTVLNETKMLLLDLVHLLLFLLLAGTRPISIWVHLLEDQEHHDLRMLKKFVQELQDIMTDLPKVVDEMEDTMSRYLKEDNLTGNSLIYLDQLRPELEQCQARYLTKLKDVLAREQKLEALGADELHVHLLKTAVWHEEHRVTVMMRRARAELCYLVRCDPPVHNNNQHLLQQEEHEFSESCKGAYSALFAFRPTVVPLWKTETGLSSRSRPETCHAVVACLSSGVFLFMLLAFLCLLPIYRFPNFVQKLKGRWYKKEQIALKTLKEYALDFFAVCAFLITLICLWRAIAIMTDVLRDLCQRRSWRAARHSIFEYPPMLLEDIFEVLRLPFRWSTYRFIAAILLWGILLPGEIYHVVWKSKFGADSVLAGIIAFAAYVLTLGFPLLFTLDLAGVWSNLDHPSDSSLPVTAIGLYFLLLLLYLLLCVYIRRKHAGHLASESYRYLRWNWSNVVAMLSVVLEASQLIALPFSLPGLQITNADGYRNVAKGVLFINGDFGPWDVRLWLALAVFVVWFCTISAPVVLVQVLELCETKDVVDNIAWRNGASVIGRALFITICEAVFNVLACTNTNPAYLRADLSVECWTGYHKSVSTVAMIILSWYVVTATIYSLEYSISDNVRSLDLRTARVFSVVSCCFEGVMSAVVLLFGTQSPKDALIVLYVFNMVLMLWLKFYRKLNGYPAVNADVFAVARIAAFALGAWTSLTLLVNENAFSHPSDDKPFIMLLIGWGVIALCALFYGYRATKPTEHTKARDAVKTQLLEIETKLAANGCMLKGWASYRKEWQRRVRMAILAQENEDDMLDNPDVQVEPVIGERAAGPDAVSGPPPAYATTVTQIPIETPAHDMHAVEAAEAGPPPSYVHAVTIASTEIPLVEHPSGIEMQVIHSSADLNTNENTSVAEAVGHPSVVSIDTELVSDNSTAPIMPPPSAAPASVTMTTTSPSDVLLNETVLTVASPRDSLSIATDVRRASESSAQSSDRGSSGSGESEVSHPSGTGRSLAIHSPPPPPPPPQPPMTQIQNVEALVAVGYPLWRARLAVEHTSDLNAALNYLLDEDTRIEQATSTSAFAHHSTRMPSELQLRPRLYNNSSHVVELNSNRPPPYFDSRTTKELLCKLNGCDVFLTLERYIRYDALSFSVLTSELDAWRSAVHASSWKGLENCVPLLHTTSLSGPPGGAHYTRPPSVLVRQAEPSDVLTRAEPVSVQLARDIPAFHVPTDLEYAQLNEIHRAKMLADIARITGFAGFEQLLNLILPQSVVSWECNGTAGSLAPFKLKLRRAAKGSIGDVGVNGFGLAKGATLEIPKHVSGTIQPFQISFDDDTPLQAGKSGISVKLKALVVRQKGEKWVVGDGSRSAPFDKVLDSVIHVEWR